MLDKTRFTSQGHQIMVPLAREANLAGLTYVCPSEVSRAQS